MIPKETLEIAAKAGIAAWNKAEPDRQTGAPYIASHVDSIRAALEAAAPYLRAQALDDLTANSPRLPRDVRDAVFELVFDVINKFHFPVQNCGPRADVVEAGNVCGDIEKRIVALLRARAVTERGQGNG